MDPKTKAAYEAAKAAYKAAVAAVEAAIEADQPSSLAPFGPRLDKALSAAGAALRAVRAYES